MPPRKAAATTTEAPRRSSRVAAMPQPPPKKVPAKRKPAAPKKKKGEEGEEATEEKKDGEAVPEEKMEEEVSEAKKGTKRTQEEANAESGEPAAAAEDEPKAKKAKPNSKASAKPVSKSSRAGSKGPAKAKADDAAAAPAVDTIAEEDGDDAAKEKKKALAIGDILPKLTLKNEKGDDIHIADLAKEKGVVMFLVPKADTPGCTTQACAFRDNYAEFTKLGYDVYCLSNDTSAAGSKWQTKQNLPYALISDPKRELISTLGAGSSKTTRSHFVLEKGTGKILDVKLNVKAADSAKIALEFVQAHAK